MDGEVPKRLAILKDDARLLYLRSGNQCAFPGCRAVLIDDNGDWVGEVCHIEAALPEGERFNDSMTNEERRAPSNLLLLCHPHHVTTNNVAAYPVARLAKMKADHEAKYSQAAERIVEAEVQDVTRSTPRSAPSSLKRWREVCVVGRFTLTDEEVAAMIPEVAELVDRLADLPPSSRSLLGIIVRRGDYVDDGAFEVPWAELPRVTRRTHREIWEELTILERYGFVRVDNDEDSGRAPHVMAKNPMKSGWPFWSDLVEVCDADSLSVDDVIAGIAFEILD